MDSTTPTLSGLEPLMSIEERSEYLDVPVRTLYDWRLAGKGPCFTAPRARAPARPPGPAAAETVFEIAEGRS